MGILFTLFCWIYLVVHIIAVEPEAIYNGGLAKEDDPILLKIGNGGAGQSGLVKGKGSKLADAFIKESVKNGSKAFNVAWYKSDTTISINYLKAGIVDVGITYTESAERVAVQQKIATKPIYYMFRDHFLIVGPKSNPAKLSNTSDITTIFTQLFTSAENASATTPTRFLSRYDKSATNIKEADLWISIGQVPWATAYSTWYHQYIAYPIQALTAAILLGEYTLTDRGTILSLDSSVAKDTVIYKAAEDDEKDPLLNPAHLLIGTKATNPKMAQAFTDWSISERGQKVITSFKKNGEVLYSAAPAKKTIDVDVVEEEVDEEKVGREGRWQRVMKSVRQEEWRRVVRKEV